MTRQQLMEQRDNLKKKLDEVQEQLNKFDTEVYGGKMAKAIKLLSECLDYLNYPTVPLNYPNCADTVIEFDLDEIIDGLKTLYREEF
jgi:hypothetical protein